MKSIEGTIKEWEVLGAAKYESSHGLARASGMSKTNSTSHTTQRAKDKATTLVGRLPNTRETAS